MRVRSLVLDRRRQLALRDDEFPEPGPGEVTVSVDECGVCGSDLMHYRTADRARCLGHEIVGRVSRTGPGTDDALVGKRVTVRTSVPCETCVNCLAGRPAACRGWSRLEFHGFADAINLPVKHVVRVAEDLGDLAALIEPTYVALDLVHRANGTSEAPVLVVGTGAIGLIVTHVLRTRGFEVVAAVRDAAGRRSQIARDLGASLLTMAELRSGQGRTYSGAVVTAPYPTIADAAPRVLAGSIIVYNGIDPEERTLEIDALQLHVHRISLVPSFPHPQLGFEAAQAFLASHGEPLSALLSHRFPLERAPSAFAALDGDRGDIVKALIMCGASTTEPAISST